MNRIMDPKPELNNTVNEAVIKKVTHCELRVIPTLFVEAVSAGAAITRTF